MKRSQVWDGGLSAALGALVLLGVGLGARLWFGEPVLAPAPVNRLEYAAPGSAAAMDLPSLLAPGRFVLRFANGRAVALGDPGDARFVELWGLCRSVFRQVTPAAVASAKVTDRSAAMGAASAAQASLEVEFPSRLPWDRLWAILAEAGDGGQASRREIDEALVPVPPTPEGGEAAVYLLAGQRAWRVSIASAVVAPVAQALLALEPDRAGYELEPLEAAPAGVEWLPGVLVPRSDFHPPAVTLLPEGLDAASLAQTLFPDPSVVRRADQADGSRVFTDGEASLLVAPTGQVQWWAPLAPGAETAARLSWTQDLAAAAHFVGRHGGWPPTAVLWWTGDRLARGSLALASGGPVRLGYAFAFALRYLGLPVLGPPALRVDVGDAGVVRYERYVPMPGRAVAAPSAGTAADALGVLARRWPAELEGIPRVVEEVVPAYLPDLERGILMPAWAVRLQDGRWLTIDPTHQRVGIWGR